MTKLVKFKKKEKKRIIPLSFKLSTSLTTGYQTNFVTSAAQSLLPQRELPACSVGQQGWESRRRTAKQEGLERSYYYHNFRLNAPLQLLPPPPSPPPPLLQFDVDVCTRTPRIGEERRLHRNVWPEVASLFLMDPRWTGWSATRPLFVQSKIDGVYIYI